MIFKTEKAEENIEKSKSALFGIPIENMAEPQNALFGIPIENAEQKPSEE